MKNKTCMQQEVLINNNNNTTTQTTTTAAVIIFFFHYTLHFLVRSSSRPCREWENEKRCRQAYAQQHWLMRRKAGPVHRTFRYNSMSHFLLRDLANKVFLGKSFLYFNRRQRKKSICKGLSPPVAV